MKLANVILIYIPDLNFWIFIRIDNVFYNTVISCYILSAGFMYPVVTHWAWDGSGWLANGPDGLAYQVRHRDETQQCAVCLSVC